MKLAICELYNGVLYGNHNIELQKHYLVYEICDIDDFFDDIEELEDTLERIYYLNNNGIRKILLERTRHSTIRNYKNILKDENYYQLHIIDDFEFETGELCAILKTSYLSILQRKWKKYCYLKNIFTNRILTRQYNYPLHNYCKLVRNIERRQITI